MRSAIDLFLGLRLSRTPTSPNWNEPSTRQVRWPSSVAAATARLTASVVRPTPPLGPNTATTRPGSPSSRSTWGRTATAVAPPLAAAGGADRDAGELLLLAGVDLPDRRGQLVRGERLDQELARPGQHRAAEVVGLALDGHHHDRGARHLGGQALRRRDAVHVRHVDVHQDDVRRELRRHLDGFATRRRRPDDLDVRLEAQELREVIAGLRDVVDDEDADLVCHGSRVGRWPGCRMGCGRRWAGGEPAHRVARSGSRTRGGRRATGRTAGTGSGWMTSTTCGGQDPEVVDQLAEGDARGREGRAGESGRRWPGDGRARAG